VVLWGLTIRLIYLFFEIGPCYSDAICAIRVRESRLNSTLGSARHTTTDGLLVCIMNRWLISKLDRSKLTFMQILVNLINYFVGMRVV